MQGEFPMKKVLLVPLFTIAALASHTWAQFCCYEANSYNNNEGYCGVVASCGDGGTLMSSCASCNVGTGTKDEGQSCGSYCKWDTGCVEIKTDPGGLYGPAITSCDAAISNCDANGLRYSSSGCTGTPIGGVESCNAYCKWDTGCVEIKPDPTGQYGTATADCAAAISNCQSNGQYFTNSSCSGGGGDINPILSGTTVTNLTVLAQSGSLHISSLKDAKVSLFNMAGKQVFSQNVSAGYNTLSLSNQKQGIYFAVVSSGSSKQTVRVVLK
jgi:hypothetical protein